MKQPCITCRYYVFDEEEDGHYTQTCEVCREKIRFTMYLPKKEHVLIT